MAFAIIYRQELREYDFGAGHSFRGDRYRVFPQFLRENLPQDDNYKIIEAEQATDEDLFLICQKEYIDFTREYYKAASAGLSYPGQFSLFQSMDNHPIGKPGKLEETARLIIGQGFTINIPMPVYAGYDSYNLAFESIVQPVTQEFKPQIIIRNGGSDPHFADGLTHLELPTASRNKLDKHV